MKISRKEIAGEKYLQITGKHRNALIEKMLENNPLNGVLIPEIMEVGESVVCGYRITGKESLCSYHERKHMDSGEILLLLEQLAEQMEQLEEHLISSEYLLLDPEYIFYSKEQSLEVCCRVERGKEREYSLEGLLAFLMKWMSPASNLEMKKIYWIYEEVQKENRTLPRIMKESMEVSAFEKEVLSIPMRKEKKWYHLFTNRNTSEKSIIYEKDDYAMESQDETIELDTELLGEKEYVHRLKRIGKEMRDEIPIYSYPAFVGKSEDMDVVIPIPTVSGRHAQFQKIGEEIWLRDLGSLNGTYRNDVRLKESVVVTSGDRLRFADQEYFFE